MKNFKKFLEEITIKGSPGVPDDYLSDRERKTKQELGITGRENPMQFGGRLMQLLAITSRMVEGKEKELEDLALEVILNNFSEIIEGVELDIKLVKPGSQDIKNLLDSDDSDDTDIEFPKFKQIKDPDLINKIHKAKIGNVIIQGEAKNTKNIIHSEEVKEGLYKIFDQRKADDLLNSWKEMTELAHKLDWVIPIEIKADMMERQPEGMAGAVKVQWDDKEDDEDDKSSDFTIDDILSDEEIDFSYEEETYNPKIIARGVDFPMLIHETVKGIFELIAAVSLPGESASPEEIEQAKIVKYNVSSFEDEAEDFRTGPQIAADFRDFIAVNKHIDNYPNLRAYVFGYMMDSSKLSDKDFLNLFRGILNKTDEARQIIDDIIEEIVEELNDYELQIALDSDLDIKDDETEIDAIVRKSEESEDTKDISTMSQREIQNLIDQALDNEDYEEVRKLSNYLKEGKNIYLSEIKKILESKK